MSLVAILIANESRPAITDAVLAETRAVLRTDHQPRILHGEVAAEILVSGAPQDAPALARRLRAALASEPLDIAVLPAGPHRRKRLFLADMDSTMIEQECIDELAHTIGLKAEVSAITERAMRGEIAFEPALRERVALLRDLPVAVVDDLIANRITLTPGGRTLVRTMKAHGTHTCLVSGGFTLFTGPVAALIGFDEAHATTLGVRAGRLTGAVEEPIVGQETKRAALVALRSRFGLDPADTLAVGDGANDLAMLEEAGLGVAFRAKPKVAAAADVRIDHGDLTALLYLQGFSASEFVN
ncbi:phosphoserine phosphatase SerB [Methylobacterium sp. BTF04]|uniref:phosphoserine phosphatase SerB n=1 Tax=Methylobacterium sp. BTF04 TaxID=2708300 RepID=UPI0013D2377E|nr:phosphoserine phosphatase SerB [Methylobacterium sp. BTF04]NEU11717.1 phosphoserine phosphatase SerB [Methylobacterium sp. BTF04]